MIVAGFSGIGKSTIANSGKYRIVDLESSDFNKKNSDWYITYCNIAKRLSDQNYLVFVSCHKNVRNYFKQNDIDYVVIYPSEDLVYDWITKLQHRYQKNKNIKNLNALERVEKYYFKDIEDIEKNDKKSIMIDDINYKLEDYIDEIYEIYNR